MADAGRNEGATREVDVVVVGAGLAGLTAGVVAARAGCRVLVLDGRRPGGRAAVTVVTGRAGEQVHLNGGPRALYTDGAGRRVLRGLGIEPTGATPTPGRSWAQVGGRFELLPDGPGTLLRTRLVPTRAKIRLARTLTALKRVDPAPLAGRSASDWVSEVAGPDLAPALAALVRLATYQADLDRLSADAAALQLRLALRGGVRYLDGGWQQLVDALLSRGTASGMTVARDAVRSVAPDGAGHRVVTDTGDVRARAVVLAPGTPEAAGRILGRPVMTPEHVLAGAVACLELAVAAAVPRRFVLGIDDPVYLSVHSPPARLAPPGVEVVHLMRYGVRDPAGDRADLEDLARRSGIRSPDVVASRFLHRMVVSPAAPTAATGGLPGRPPVEVPGRPGLFLAGDWVGPEGLLADASFASGERAGTLAAAAGAGAGDAPVASSGRAG